MKHVVLAVLLLAVMAAAGCAKVVGPYYLQKEEYETGIEVLGERLQEDPQDASAAYYVGRYYLGLNKPKQGLGYFKKAVALDPDNDEYVFWTGVAYWALMDYAREREAYEKTIRLNPKHISANLYIGHGYVDEGKWAEALRQYDVVLNLDPYNPEALFNKAVSLNGLGKHEREKTAWKEFLKYYPEGSMALQATERLNLLGDFSYRNFILGKRNVTLAAVTFKPGTDLLESDGKMSLNLLGAMMNSNRTLEVHIVAYNKGNRDLAARQAKAVKRYVLRGNPKVDSERLLLSWFDSAEKVLVGTKTFPVDQSVQFITMIQ